MSLCFSSSLKRWLEFTHLNGVQLPSITLLFILSGAYIQLPLTQKRIRVRIKPKLVNYYMPVDHVFGGITFFEGSAPKIEVKKEALIF